MKTTRPPRNNNEFTGSLILSPTQTIPFTFGGDNAHIGCSISTGGPFIWGRQNDSTLIELKVFSLPFNCIASTGTYPIYFNYQKNGSIAFSNIGRTLGSLTFIANDGNYVEGFFSATAWCQSTGCNPATDSVMISGSFKGTLLR